MMSKTVCINCNGEYDSSLEKCPYCGTMNRKTALSNFRKKVSSFIDSMLGLKDEINTTVSRMILISILRGFLIVTVCIVIAAIFAYFSNVNYYNDKKYDEETLNNIIWENENLDKLEQAYLNNDFAAIEKLYYENSHVASNWKHYGSYMLKSTYQEIISDEETDEYKLMDILYYLYYPDYYARTNKLSKEEYEEYLNSKESVIAYSGYTDEELKEIYKKYADSYGFLSTSDIRKYLKENDDD